MINTVIRYIMSNSIKFTQKEGFSSAECENDVDNVKVTVSDTGWE